MNKVKKYVLAIIMIVAMISSTGVNSRIYAADFWVTAKDNGNGTLTATIGGSVVGSFTLSANGASASVYLDDIGDSKSATLKTGAGSFTVVATAVNASNASYTVLKGDTVSTTVKVTVPASGGGSSNSGTNTAPNTNTNSNANANTNTQQQPQTPVEDTRSKDNNLASLSVEQGSLSPEFSVDNIEYTVNLDSSTTKINIVATASDAKATVSGAGEQTVEVGENVFQVVVTAENKSTKTYTIKAIVDETPTNFTTLEKKKLGVVKNLKEVPVPNGFEETTVTLNDEVIKAWTNGAMNKTIVYLIDENNEKNFYLFDKGVTSIFKPITLLGQNVYIVDIPSDKQKLEGMKYQEVTIDGNKMMGWTFTNKAFKNYSVISVMNEFGEMVYYQYESTQNTLQLYSNAAPVTMKEYTDALDYKTYMVIVGVIAGIFAITTIGAIVLCIRFKKANNKIVTMVTKGIEK